MTLGQLFSGNFDTALLMRTGWETLKILIPCGIFFFAGRMKGINEGIDECRPIMNLQESVINTFVDVAKSSKDTLEDVAESSIRLEKSIIELKEKFNEINSKTHNR